MKVQKEFHIHIDAQFLDGSIEKHLIERFQFYIADFCKTEPDRPRIAPYRHLSKKIFSGTEFRMTFRQVVAILKEKPELFSGYVEGEYVAEDFDFPTFSVLANIPAPMKLHLRPLPSGTHKADEIHITLDKLNSDPRLLQKLRDMGSILLK